MGLLFSGSFAIACIWNSFQRFGFFAFERVFLSIDTSFHHKTRRFFKSTGFPFL